MTRVRIIIEVETDLDLSAVLGMVQDSDLAIELAENEADDVEGVDLTSATDKWRDAFDAASVEVIPTTDKKES